MPEWFRSIGWLGLVLGALAGWLLSAFEKPQDVWRWVLMKCDVHPKPRLGDTVAHSEPVEPEKWWHIEVTLTVPWWCPTPDFAVRPFVALIGNPSGEFGLLFVDEPIPLPNVSLRGKRRELPFVTRRTKDAPKWRAPGYSPNRSCRRGLPV